VPPPPSGAAGGPPPSGKSSNPFGWLAGLSGGAQKPQTVTGAEPKSTPSAVPASPWQAEGPKQGGGFEEEAIPEDGSCPRGLGCPEGWVCVQDPYNAVGVVYRCVDASRICGGWRRDPCNEGEVCLKDPRVKW